MPGTDTKIIAHRLSRDSRSLLDVLDRLSRVHLAHVAFDLHQADGRRLLLSVQREEVVTETPGEALTGFLFPWDPDAEAWDYFHPIAHFTALDQLQTWLVEHHR